MPKNLWGEALLTATYLYNRTPNSSINFKTPYQSKYNVLPNLDNVRIFGSSAYCKEPSSLISKLDSKATPYYLIGFVGSNIYKLCNPKTNKVIRLLLAIAAYLDWEIYCWDIKQAFPMQ